MKGDTIMKKIQILAILVIVALVFTGLKGGIEGAVDGWNQAGDSREFDFSTVNVAVKADETLIADSLFNSVAKRNIPYCIGLPGDTSGRVRLGCCIEYSDVSCGICRLVWFFLFDKDGYGCNPSGSVYS